MGLLHWSTRSIEYPEKGAPVGNIQEILGDIIFYTAPYYTAMNYLCSQQPVTQETHSNSIFVNVGRIHSLGNGHESS